jgi:hypothetical protein
VAKLKVKNSLDLIDLEIKVLGDDPDLFEEN